MKQMYLYKDNISFTKRYIFQFVLSLACVELVWRSSCVMGCRARVQGSIPSGDGVKTEQREIKCGSVSELPRCRWDVKHNQPTLSLSLRVFCQKLYWPLLIFL